MNLFSTKGRLRRSHYLLCWVLTYICYQIGNYILDFFITDFIGLFQQGIWTTAAVFVFLQGIWTAAVFVFFMIQSVRRAHDIGITGWVTIIPIFNPFILTLIDGTRGDNKYGKDPKSRANLFETFNTTIEATTIETTPDETTTEKTTKSTNYTTNPEQQSEYVKDEDAPPAATTTTAKAIPANYYILSSDGKTLMKWFDNQSKMIKMNNDPVLKNVTTIGKDVFYDCDNIVQITLPEGLTSIQKYAFDGCSSLQTIFFPSKVAFVGENLFGQDCPATLTFEGSVPPVLEGDFAYNEQALQAIYVPSGAANTYRQQWPKYAKLII